MRLACQGVRTAEAHAMPAPWKQRRRAAVASLQSKFLPLKAKAISRLPLRVLLECTEKFQCRAQRTALAPCKVHVPAYGTYRRLLLVEDFFFVVCKDGVPPIHTMQFIKSLVIF
jgi:hypothetical protein